MRVRARVRVGLGFETLTTRNYQGLRAYFGKWGTVLDCLVLRDKLTEKSRGFGFVTLVEEEVSPSPSPNPTLTLTLTLTQP